MVILDLGFCFNLIFILSLPGTDCKKTPPSNKIVDGVDAGINEFPYIVSINATSEGPDGQVTNYGTGVLVGNGYVLTVKSLAFRMDGDAAVSEKDLSIFPNLKNDLKHPSYATLKPLKVEKRFCPPMEGYENILIDKLDLVLLKLKMTNKRDKAYQSIIPVKKGLPDKKYRFKIAGWGMTDKTDFNTKRGDLQVAGVSVTFQNCVTECDLTLVGEDDGTEKAVCFGDQGGPVVLYKDKNPSLVGLILPAEKECTTNKFINVMPLKDWIDKVISGDEIASTNCLSSGKQIKDAPYKLPGPVSTRSYKMASLRESKTG
ncbi:chymotrypsinogen 2-like [Brevipalpus obovatus]|uniref:chymotrypsinogen 2-like n=1 Tax=Brevipalpus obovatus TaxID=246614 RepID=UPI003D9DD08C